jgi:hypothetical protein
MEEDNNSVCSINSNTPEYGEHCSFYDTKNEIDTIAFNGRCFIYQKKDDFFSEKGYISKILTNPTYRDLVKIADELIETTGDYHHRFFEGIRIDKEVSSGLFQIEIYLGS